VILFKLSIRAVTSICSYQVLTYVTVTHVTVSHMSAFHVIRDPTVRPFYKYQE
jgi:hypothetical protein